MNKLLKNYVESVARKTTLTETEILEFLRGLEEYEVLSTLSDQGIRKVDPSPYIGSPAGISNLA